MFPLQGLLRQIKCYIALGNLTAASRALEDLKSRDTENSTSYGTETTNINRLRELESNADKDMVKNDYRKVRRRRILRDTLQFIELGARHPKPFRVLTFRGGNIISTKF